MVSFDWAVPPDVSVTEVGLRVAVKPEGAVVARAIRMSKKQNWDIFQGFTLEQKVSSSESRALTRNRKGLIFARHFYEVCGVML